MENQFADVIWPGWEVVRKLGEGSFGGVYEIQRVLPDGQVEKGALKKLTLPKSTDEIEELRSDQFDDASITAHFSNQLKSLVGEYAMVKKLSGCPNIVHSLDLRYIQHDDGIGWDLYIRMELLTPLKKALTGDYSEQMVLKIGGDLCGALIACEKEHIIHRDIKPENVLVSDSGVFKLGDFGVAKVAEENGTGTVTGTMGYMAPEITNHEAYGQTADIYSLGMVLYWLMNGRTLPFLPFPPAIPTAEQRQEASNRRFRGDPLPAPQNGSAALKQVVLKACAFRPEDRYQTAAEMLEALRDCTEAEKTVCEPAGQRAQPPEPVKRDEPVPAVPVPNSLRQPEAPTAPRSSVAREPKNQAIQKPQKSAPKRILIPGIAAVILCLAAVLVLAKPGKKTEKAPDVTISATVATEMAAVQTEEEPMLKMTLTPSRDASAVDLQHDGPLVQGTIRALSADAEITVDGETGVIEAALPLRTIGMTDAETVVRDLICSPKELYFVLFEGVGFRTDKTEGLVNREDILEARTVTAGEMQGQFGMPEEGLRADGVPLTITEDMTCLYLKLTKAGAEKMHAFDNADGEITMALDITRGNPTVFAFLFAAQDGESFVLVSGKGTAQGVCDAIAYALNHETLNKTYDYSYAIEPEVCWEERSDAAYFGEKQCAFDALPDPENAVSVYMEITNYERLADGAVDTVIRRIKDKMDIIGLPYAFGRDAQEEDLLIVCTSPESLNAKLLDHIARAYSPSFETSSDIFAGGLKVADAEVISLENDAIGIQCRFENPEKLEDITSKLRWKDDKTLWIGGYKDPQLSTKVTTTITDNVLVLDSLPMLAQDAVGEEYRTILELFAYCLRQDYIDASVRVREYTFQSEQGQFGLGK